jgi:UDP:flavonoid glycosyltransferase YjiC (YdhE family)
MSAGKSYIGSHPPDRPLPDGLIRSYHRVPLAPARTRRGRARAAGRRRLGTVRVTVLAVGSRGDVEPYVALGLGLRAAGHEVRLGTHARFGPLVAERGLGFAELEGDPRALVESERGQAWLAAGASPIAFWRAFRRLVDRSWDRSVATAWAACEGAEAVVYSALAWRSRPWPRASSP